MATKTLNAFSVDVEDWFHVANLSGAIPVSSWDKRELRIQSNIDIILDILETHNAKGTFFILGWVARKLPSLIKSIHSRGHEIGCHTDDHQSLYIHDRKTLTSNLKTHKAFIDDATGEEVIGFRAPNFSIVAKNTWALEVLQECGFKYDSSVFPFKRANYGIPNAPLLPYCVDLGEGKRITEFPPTVSSFMGKTLPSAGGGYFRFFPYAFTKTLLNKHKNASQPIFFYIHPWEVDPSQPYVASVPWNKRFMHYVNLHRTADRLRMLCTDFAFTTYRNVYEQINNLPLLSLSQLQG